MISRVHHFRRLERIVDEHGFWILMALGIAVRIFRFGDIPPGLNQDEASSAYDAFALLQTGMDRHGFPFPVMLVSWGSGMHALGAYLTLPFIAIFGLTVTAARLPHLVAGIATLWVFHAALREATDKRTALIGLALLAINPWHIILSRWSLESNLFPPIFLLGVFLLLRGLRRPRLLPASAAAFGLSLYAYGTAYIAVPVFVVLALPLLWLHRLPVRKIALALLAGILVGLPIAIFVLINTAQLTSVVTPLLSIPRLTSEPRFFTASDVEGWRENFQNAVKLLVTQDDGTLYNVLPGGDGLFYAFSLPLMLLGIALCVTHAIRSRERKGLFLLAWLLSALVVGSLMDVNVNRFNIVFLPLLYFLALGVMFLSRSRVLAVAFVIAYTLSFGRFGIRYFHEFPRELAPRFFSGFLEAVHEASASTTGPVCVTDSVNMPYIYVLFSEQTDPARFRATARIGNPGAEFQSVESFDRYTFGLGRCDHDQSAAFVVHNGELAQFHDPARYAIRTFEYYSAVLRR